MQRVREIPCPPNHEENTDMEADGFLLSQFLSSSSNKRSDEFGGSAEKRAEIVLRIIRAIRREVPQSFCVGVKINTADHMNPEGFDKMLRQVELIHKEKPDYIQLSGGSFEHPEVCSFLVSSTIKFARS
jgi:2,4-dienoyl-CoA reductase-like NADH-dependent reductase (Old Yellow Enzyme family)